MYVNRLKLTMIAKRMARTHLRYRYKCARYMPISLCQKTTRTRAMRSMSCHKISVNVYNIKHKLFCCGWRKGVLS